ncbi:MAG: hypothetical protein ACOYVK_20885 [Bacillota bacterium]
MSRIGKISSRISHSVRQDRDSSNKERQIREKNQKKLQDSIRRAGPKVEKKLKDAVKTQLNRTIADGATFTGAAVATYKKTKDPVKAVGAGVVAVKAVHLYESADKMVKLGDRLIKGTN